MTRSIENPPIARANHRSITLVVRRAVWANRHGFPMHNGSAIAPEYVPNEIAREILQQRINEWWHALDPRARSFLGNQYECLVTSTDQ